MPKTYSLNLVNKNIFKETYFNIIRLIIFTMPIVVYGTTFWGGSLRLSRFFVLLIIPLLVYNLKNSYKLLLKDKFFIFCFLPFFLYLALSLLWTPGSSIAFGLNRLGALLEILIIYVSIIIANLNVERFYIITKIYVLSSVVPLFFACWQILNNIFVFSTAQLPFISLLIPGKYEIYKDRVTYFLDDGYTRISSCMGEPTIFGSYMTSVLLLSFAIFPKTKITKIVLFSFQFIVLITIFSSLSKMAMISLLFGILIIFRKERKKLFILITSLLVFFLFVIASVIYLKGTEFIFRRLFSDSGHVELLFKTLNQFNKVNLLIGEGVGSIPGLSTNKFLLSRIFESGLIGLIFTVAVTLIPFKFFIIKGFKYKLTKIQNIYFGVICSIVLGLHIYDNFIYLWPWILIAISMSNLLSDDSLLTDGLNKSQ